MKKIFLVGLFINCITCFSQAEFQWSSLEYGPFKVGFKTIHDTAKDGTPLLVSLWFPAANGGDKMTMKDYVETGLVNGKQHKEMLRNEFKKTLELPFLFGIGEILAEDYKKLLLTPVAATKDAEMKKAKWPLIISDTEPVSLFISNEWLASQGFIVAVPSAQFPAPKNDSALYEGPTDALDMVLQYMIRQPFVDTANISALGFGGGTQAAFYLSMKKKVIKCLVNLEGGIFMPLSKTTLSKDYKPAKFTIPLLHIVRPEIILEENVNEFIAVKSPKYRVTTLPAAIRHHDFSVYGRVVNAVLQKRGKEAALATDVFTGVHQLILYFLEHHRLTQSSIQVKQMFQLEIF